MSSMQGSTFRLLEDVPVFSLTNAIPEPVNFVKMFKGWPSEKISLLHDAQNARDLMVQHLKMTGPTMVLRIEDIDKYLPFALAIEKELKENPRISPNDSLKFVWKQAPIVAQKFETRMWNGKFFSNEVLHVVWLKANLMLNEGYLIAKQGEYDKCVQLFREMAGIYNFLAADRLRVICGEAVPVEFKPPIFQSLTSLALAQAYAAIAAKAERDGMRPINIGKVAYTVASTLENSIEAFNNAEPKDATNPMYLSWLESQSKFFHALSAIYIGFATKEKKQGMAIALVRLGLAKLQETLAVKFCHERIMGATKKLIEKVTELERAWSEENFAIMNDYVPQPEEAEAQVASSCTMMPGLPQPIPFVLPEPSLVRPDASSDPVPQGDPLAQSTPSPTVKKIVPPK